MAEIKNRENEVLRAVIRQIEQTEGIQLILVREPDKEVETNCRAGKKIEAIYGVSGKDEKYCVEHTLIESFPGQIKDGKKFQDFVGPLENDLRGKLPQPGTYWLTISVGALNECKSQNITAIREVLKEWILLSAPQLKIAGAIFNQENCIKAKPKGVPFLVTISRLDYSNDGSLICCREMPEGLSALRRERIQKSLNDKCPKLQRAKETEHNSHSTLILESNDIALGNYYDIAVATIDLMKRRNKDVPDRVYLVETENTEWLIWLLKKEDEIFPKVSNPGPFRPAEKSL